jgi:hypothetical protein
MGLKPITISAVYVNVDDRTVTDIEVPPDGLDHLYARIGTNVVERFALPTFDLCWVDEEGHFQADQKYWRYSDRPGVLAGSAIIVGPDNKRGKSTDVQHDAMFYRYLIRFQCKEAAQLECDMEGRALVPAPVIIAFK